jgi:hypothetical protein
MEALGGKRRYSSYSFTTSALDGGEWSASRPSRALPPVPNVQEAGWARQPVRTQESKVKVKQSRYTPWRRLGGEEYSSYSFTTSALDGGEWSASRPGRALSPGKGPPVPIVQEAGWAPEPVWTQRLEEKSSASAGDRTPIARSSSP